jgi:hypothetical protein
MTAGDMCVLMMVCLNYEMLIKGGLFNNFDNAYASAVKLPVVGEPGRYYFVVDYGFKFHSDEGAIHSFDYHTDRFNSI